MHVIKMNLGICVGRLFKSMTGANVPAVLGLYIHVAVEKQCSHDDFPVTE